MSSTRAAISTAIDFVGSSGISLPLAAPRGSGSPRTRCRWRAPASGGGSDGSSTAMSLKRYSRSASASGWNRRTCTKRSFDDKTRKTTELPSAVRASYFLPGSGGSPSLNSERRISIVGSTDSSPKARAASSSPDDLVAHAQPGDHRSRARATGGGGRGRTRAGRAWPTTRASHRSWCGSRTPTVIAGGSCPQTPSKAGPNRDREDSNQLRASGGAAPWDWSPRCDGSTPHGA